MIFVVAVESVCGTTPWSDGGVQHPRRGSVKEGLQGRKAGGYQAQCHLTLSAGGDGGIIKEVVGGILQLFEVDQPCDSCNDHPLKRSADRREHSWPRDLRDAETKGDGYDGLLSLAHLKIPNQPLRDHDGQQIRQYVSDTDDDPERNLIALSVEAPHGETCGLTRSKHCALRLLHG